jgi:hypothetical protein
MISGPIFGLFSDTYGRKKALILSVILEIFSTISSVISATIYQFIAARFFMGIAGYARYLSSLLLRKFINYASLNQFRISKQFLNIYCKTRNQMSFVETINVQFYHSLEKFA